MHAKITIGMWPNEKLEHIGKLPDVMDVVEVAAQLFNTNDTDNETNNTNDESDDEKHLKLNEYPSYPHTSGRMGAMAIYSPTGVGGLVVVVCMSFFWHRCVFWHSHVCSCLIYGGRWLVAKYLK